MGDGRFCAGCRRHLPADSFADDRSCRRCLRVRLLTYVADDLEARRYPFAPVVRQAARLLADVDDGGDADRRCEECGDRLLARSTGRPARFCSGRCRKRAHRSRNRHESGHSAHVASPSGLSGPRLRPASVAAGDGVTVAAPRRPGAG